MKLRPFTRADPPSPKHPQIMEPGMLLPTSVLDDCGNSFIAVDEGREKASTHFFVDMGIMSLLCRHNRCLFAVNMTHKGHYTLVLLQEFFRHIPANAIFGLLYNIAYQLKQSMLNFSFLSEIFPCMIFAASIFHAYGHQWPCQVKYHPQKCKGCKRFWSAFPKLIPLLRASGVCMLSFILCMIFTECCFILDLHIKYLENLSHAQLESWLAWHWKSAYLPRPLLSLAPKTLVSPGNTLCAQWHLC